MTMAERTSTRRRRVNRLVAQRPRRRQRSSVFFYCACEELYLARIKSAAELAIGHSLATGGRSRKEGLLLVPSIFCWPDVFLTLLCPSLTPINYPSSLRISNVTACFELRLSLSVESRGAGPALSVKDIPAPVWPITAPESKNSRFGESRIY